MILQTKNLAAYRSYTGSKRLSFGHKMVLDMGASKQEVNLRILDLYEDGTDCYSCQTTVNKSKGQFTSEEHFVNDLVATIIDACKEAQRKIRPRFYNNQVNKDEEKLTKIVLLPPGNIHNNSILSLPNVKKTNGDSISDVDCAHIKSVLKEQGLKEGISIAENLEIKAVNDSAASGIAIAQKIDRNPKYKELLGKNKYLIGVITGGGCGISNIKNKNGQNLDIEAVSSNYVIQDNRVKKLSELGASVPVLIKSFGEALGIKDPEILNTIVNTGNAKIVTSDAIELDRKRDKHVLAALESTGIYKTSFISDELAVLKITDKEKFIDAFKVAVNNYTDAIARLAVIRINDLATSMVLTGPAALGINEALNIYTSAFDGKKLEEIIMDKVNVYISENSSLKSLKNTYGFSVICDDSVNVNDNTEAARALLDNATQISEFNGSWITISIQNLNNNGEIKLSE